MNATAVASPAPVEALPGEPALGTPEQGIAICLSGGGYRAMLFHTGAIWRLAELGLLGPATHTIRRADGSRQPAGTLQRISSVSGGSLLAGMLGLKWKDLAVGQPGLVDRYVELVVAPIRKIAHESLAGKDPKGVMHMLWNIAVPGSVNDHIIAAYKKHLFGDATLQDLPDFPRFVINASNLQSGALWRFMKPYMRDWRVGEVKRPTISLAQAVAASSAFPPVLAPAPLSLRDEDYTPNSGGQGADNLQRTPFTTRPVLADGGVYDNLGLETAYKRYQTLLVSNAGAPFAVQPEVHADWVRLGQRCIDVMDNQVLSLRKRLLVGDLVAGVRHGAFWDIEQDIAVHGCAQALACPSEATMRLAHVGTDLSAKDDAAQERLINWGYAVTDAAVRAHFDSALPAPQAFPYPSGVG
jgi:NTE family protein